MDEQLLRELDQLHVDKQWSQAYEKAKSLLDAAASDSVETDLPADCLFRCARTLYNYGILLAYLRVYTYVNSAEQVANVYLFPKFETDGDTS